MTGDGQPVPVPGPRRDYAAGPFGQVHFHDTGAGVPLVLIHQAPMSSRQFEQVYGRLAARGIRGIGVDMPGYGCSDPTLFVPEIKDYARAVPAVLDHLGIRAAFVLGHHTGALIATEVAINFADRVDGLILNGPLPMSPKERQAGLDYVEQHEKGLVAQADGSHLVAVFNNRMAYANPDTDWDLATRYVAEQFIGRGPFWYGHHAAFQYDHGARLPLIDTPTLVLTNTGDQVFPQALKTMQIRPDFYFSQIEGGSIDVVDERPDEWVTQVAKFILERSRGT
jgi:pimeloyl-ACP methyl ester carboxylesterase